MAAATTTTTRGFATHPSRLSFLHHLPHPHRNNAHPADVDELSKRRRLTIGGNRLGVSRISCCCSDPAVPIRSSSPAEKRKKSDERRFDSNQRPPQRVGLKAAAALPFASEQSQFASKQNSKVYPRRRPRCTPGNTGPQSRDTPPKRDTGIASEKEWGISLLNEHVKESGTNEDASTWYRESGEELGDTGYRCRWTRMGGASHDSSSEWREEWWEKSDWTGYKELGIIYIIYIFIGVEKSGRNAEGDSWWETWQEVLHQDEWSNLARIERSAQKRAKSGTENAGWSEKWWEKYDAKGWTEKGAHKWGRLNEQSWWEKWGEHYDGRGSVLKWTDKWAETELGTKWGDKWEEKFFEGIGSRQGETWHVTSNDERWSRTWGEEHIGNGKVHKYGKSTTGESWDIVVDEETYYEAVPHYGWADVVGDSTQLLSIEPREKPPEVYPNFDFTRSPPAMGTPLPENEPPPPPEDEPPPED
ncbi:protein EARLY STARVATION 1, chloroplastic [Rosa sericea]